MRHLLGVRTLRAMVELSEVPEFDAETRRRLKREAIQIAAQLPPEHDQAIAVLAYAYQILMEFMMDEKEPDPPENAA